MDIDIEQSMSQKTHLAVGNPGFTNDSWVSTTLCGRESGETVEQNAEAEKSAVTCKLCQQIMADPKHWRHRKYLAG